METVPPSRAPRLAASMIPGPPPVMIANFLRPSSRAVFEASLYHGLVCGVRAEPKMATAESMSDSSSNPSTNSPVIRSTRHGSEWVNSLRSARTGWKRRSSSVRGSSAARMTGSIREGFDRRCIVLDQVVEERGKANMARTGVRHDAGLGQAFYLSCGIGRGEHHDRGTVVSRGGDLGLEPGLAGASNQIFSQPAHGCTDRGDADLTDHLQTAELCVNGLQARSA